MTGSKLWGARLSYKARPAIGVLAILLSVAVHAAEPSEQDPASFGGKIGMTGADSSPLWPERTHAPAQAPNILVWMIDDAGFAHLGPYGSLIDTPTIDDLAKRGLRYNNFTTTALCSPSRAAFLTGRNSHAVSMGSHAAAASGYPGYWARVPKSAATIARILQSNGYATYALGKWDHLPTEDTSTAGPFTYWPVGQGFDHFYGFLAADDNNFQPLMWLDQDPVNPWEGKSDYHLSTDIADKAIEWLSALKAATPSRPFFMYWATGAVHAPHHAPRAYIDKYRGRFDMGWDRARELILERQKALGLVPSDVQLPARDAAVAAWTTLSDTQRRVATRAMEAFAGQLDHADHEFGRIIDALRKLGVLDNTIIVVLSDNGASAEGGLEGSYNENRLSNGLDTSTALNVKFLDGWGGPSTYNHYPVGWAMAGNTPFRYYKQTVHYGGIRDPLIVSFPRKIGQVGQIRTQYHHITDLMPTLLELAGIAQPIEMDGVKQQPLDGMSMAYTFDRPLAPTRKKFQYYEMFGNRGIWSDGWKAEVIHNPEPWHIFASRPYAQDVWELYHTDVDFNELHDLAGSDPQKLKALKQLFDREARRNHVYPIGAGFRGSFDKIKQRLDAAHGHFEFAGDVVYRLPEALAPPTLNHDYAISADINITGAKTDGVIVAQGGSMGGYSLYLKEGRPVFCYNYLAEESYFVRSAEPLRSGHSTVRFEFKRTGPSGGVGTLFVDGKLVGQGTIARTESAMLSINETFDIGRDEGSQVSSEYLGTARFPGRIDRIIFDVGLK